MIYHNDLFPEKILQAELMQHLEAGFDLGYFPERVEAAIAAGRLAASTGGFWKEAEFAYRDSSVSHSQNGIYGSMWVAACIAVAFTTHDPLEVILAWLAEIPAECRLAEAIRSTLGWYQQSRSWEATWELIDQHYGAYHTVHVITQGLPEYEVLETERREIAITLLRAVGYLGAGSDLQTAAGGASPNIATPEGQFQRKLTFSLAVLPHSGAWDGAEVWRQAIAHNNPPRAFTTGMTNNRAGLARGNQPPSRSFLSVAGNNILVSAIKKAETGDALILRLYNPAEAPSQADIRLPFAQQSVCLAGLDEQPLLTADAEDSAIVAGDRLQITLPPKKIITLRMDRA